MDIFVYVLPLVVICCAALCYTPPAALLYFSDVLTGLRIANLS